MAQYTAGYNNALANATSLAIPTWEIEGLNFFSIVGKETRWLEQSIGPMTVVTGPKFYSHMEMFFDRRVRNYMDYIAGGENWWTGFIGGITGWYYWW